MSYITINNEFQTNDIHKALNHIDEQLKHSNLQEMHFKFQNGTIKEAGENGLQWYELVKISLTILQNFNANLPCEENAITITKLKEALMWQNERTRERSSRGVEGYSQK